MNLGIILTPDERSKAYLQKIIHKKITLNEVIFMNDDRQEPSYSTEIINLSKQAGFDISIPVKQTLISNDIHFHEFNFVNINNPSLVNYLSTSSIEIFIFTGGGILRDTVLNSGPKFVHLHPGIVPDYRGSTCFYYSILDNDSCGVTVYFMDPKIDAGDVIYQRKFPKPTHQFIDEVYDAYIRSETLMDVLYNNMLYNGKFTKQNPNGETYFIIHPVLKHISILSCLS